MLVLSDAAPVLSAATQSSGGAAQVDSRSVATLLLVKGHLAAEAAAAKEGGGGGVQDAVVEVVDDTSPALLRSMGHGEAGHVSTSRLAALAMAVAAEDRAAWRMYGELLSADGACVDVRGVGQYVGLDDEEGRRLAFWDVARAVQRAGHTLLGYRRRGEGWAAAAAAGTLVNPPSKGEPRVWEAGDDLVVLRINSAPAAQP